MRFRKLGNTGLIVSEMCLGAMTFGSGEGMWATVAGVSQDGVTDLVKTAFDRGINFIDTADFYSNGRSEVVTATRSNNWRFRVIPTCSRRKCCCAWVRVTTRSVSRAITSWKA
jgi:aryl-alcohol dehydrogenase-like predicted oxidoreductase